MALPELQICLLGPFQLCWDFTPTAPSIWHNPFAAKLLKIVLLRRPAPVPPAEAVRLVGGGMTGADLAAAVLHVRQALQQGATLASDEQGALSFVPGLKCWIDLDAIESHYQAGVFAQSRGEMLPAILAFQEADALYQGDLLEEVQDPWVFPARQRLQAMYTEILDRLAEGHAVLARYQDAVGFCHKALAHDPLREVTYQRMMVYYYYLGDMAGALEAYKACRYALEGAGRPVAAETNALWVRLSQSDGPAAPGVDAAAALDPSRKTRNK